MNYYLMSDGSYLGKEGIEPPSHQPGERAPIPVPRMPGDGETWDVATGVFVKDMAIAADMAVPHDHVAKAHLIKMVEASLVASGVRLTSGFLFSEAKAIGVSINQLADTVLAAAAPMLEQEVARRIQKTSARIV